MTGAGRIGIGVALGAALGAAFGNVSLGVAFGVLLGIIMAGIGDARARRLQRQRAPDGTTTWHGNDRLDGGSDSASCDSGDSGGCGDGGGGD